MTFINGLYQAENQLAKLDMAGAIADALEAGAAELQARIVEVLSQPPGEDHSAPWLRTGALRASISHTAEGTVAVVGSSSDVAVDQELGTRTIPPRPFLASTAAGAADDVAQVLATAVARHIAAR